MMHPVWFEVKQPWLATASLLLCLTLPTGAWQSLTRPLMHTSILPSPGGVLVPRRMQMRGEAQQCRHTPWVSLSRRLPSDAPPGCCSWLAPPPSAGASLLSEWPPAGGRLVRQVRQTTAAYLHGLSDTTNMRRDIICHVRQHLAPPQSPSVQCSIIIM